MSEKNIIRSLYVNLRLYSLYNVNNKLINTDLPHYSPLVVDIGVSMRGDKSELIPITSVEQDVFSKLGMVGWQVWNHLKKHPEPTAASIARSAKLHPWSVRRSLNKLEKYEFVSYRSAEGMYYGESKTQDELERLAAALKLLGKSEKRKRIHQCEREQIINLELAKARKQWRKRYLV